MLLVVEVIRVDHLAAWNMPACYGLQLLRANAEGRESRRPAMDGMEQGERPDFEQFSKEPVVTESGFVHSPGMSRLLQMRGMVQG